MDIEKKKEERLKEISAALETAGTEVDKLRVIFERLTEENNSAQAFREGLDRINTNPSKSSTTIPELVRKMEILDTVQIGRPESEKPVMADLGTLTLTFYELAKILTAGLFKLNALTHLQANSIHSKGGSAFEKEMALELLDAFKHNSSDWVNSQGWDPSPDSNQDFLLKILEQNLLAFNEKAITKLNQPRDLKIAKVKADLDEAQLRLDALTAELAATQAAMGK